MKTESCKFSQKRDFGATWMMYKRFIPVALIGFLLLFSGCSVVKEYQMVYINDPDMGLSASPSQQFETNFQVYREGAAGANGGKTGGGCGCN